MAFVGFCGSRSLSPALRGFVARVVASASAGRAVAVGCAAGADAFVRAAAPSALVFSVSSGRWGRGRAAFARRSAALVRAVAASSSAGPPGPLFVGFVSVPCPAGVVPASSWRSGRPVSGSWSSLALAAGLGVPVVVCWSGPSAWSAPSWPGSWSPGPWSGSWRFRPAALQAPLL